MTCPYCDGNQIRRLARNGIAEVFLSWLGRWPYGCESCCSRFLLQSCSPADPVYARRSVAMTGDLHRLGGAVGHCGDSGPRSTPAPGEDKVPGGYAVSGQPRGDI